MIDAVVPTQALTPVLGETRRSQGSASTPPKKTMHLKRAIDDWEQVQSNDMSRDQALASGIATDHGLHQQVALSLGPSIRWRLLLHLRQLPEADFAEECGLSGRTFQRLINNEKSPRTSNVGNPESALRRVAADGFIPRTRESFFDYICYGRNAPQVFLTWLQGDPPHSDKTGRGARPFEGDGFLARLRRENFNFLESGRRNTVIDAIWKHLRAADAQPILCIHSSGMAHGLSALALHLWDLRKRRLPNDDRSWCYLPVSRSLPGGDEHGYAILVSRLAAWYRGDDPTKCSASHQSTQVRDELAFIRQKMISNPAILIFDGYSGASGCGSHLVDFIRAEPLAPLLDRLVRPVVGFPDNAIDPAVFTRTRILVLGNQPLDAGIGQRGLNVHSATQRFYPGPERAHVRDLLSLLQIQPTWREPIVEALEHYEREIDVSDTNIRLLGALSMLRSDTYSLADTKAWLKTAFARKRDGPSCKPTPDLKGLCLAICGLLRERQDGTWDALAFIALDPAGQRPTTLRRLMAIRYGRDIWPVGARGEERKPDTGTTHPQPLLLRALSGVLVFGGDGIRNELYSLDREAEYDPSVWGDAWRESPDLDSPTPTTDVPMAYDIPDAELRAGFVQAFYESDEAAFCEIQRLLAEEALQQHTILARHGASGGGSELRSQERLVQSLYHGLLSLPSPGSISSRSTRDATSISQKEEEGFSARGFDFGLPPARFSGSLPSNHAERLRILYVDLYRDRLERRPQWALTRTWEAIYLKRDLLAFFLTQMPRSVLPDDVSLDIQLLGDDARANLARAALRCADMVGLQAILDDVAQARDDRGLLPSPYGKLSVEKLVLEMTYEDAQSLCTKHLAALIKYDFPLRLNSTMSAAELERRVHDERLALMRCPEFSSVAASELCSFLDRLAVVVANVADLSASPSKRGQISDGLSGFQAAYVLFRLAQELLDEFVQRGRAIDYNLSTSTARVFARTALTLAIYAERNRQLMCANAFYRAARHTIDQMARAVDRFPAERADFLIIEAIFARRRWKKLRLAAALLEEAEPLLPSEHERPGLHLGFLLERAKVFGRLAQPHAHEKAQIWRMIADRDIERIRRIAQVYGLSLYESLADDQDVASSTRQVDFGVFG